MREGKLHLDCASFAPSNHGSTHVAFTPLGLGRLSAGIWNPHGYINQPARAGCTLSTSARPRTDHTGSRQDNHYAQDRRRARRATGRPTGPLGRASRPSHGLIVRLRAVALRLAIPVTAAVTAAGILKSLGPTRLACNACHSVTAWNQL